ncbi:MAG: hypothetical protein M0017_04050 [Desulfobacteraceae bacterium]|nr:hypothetical protein [Desulfobacteraceae bacterium]
MDARTRETYLKPALVVVGVLFLLLYPLMIYWPAGWQWQPVQPEYEQMIAGVYGTLGLFLLFAARRPQAASSLIRFTAWSSLVSGGIMAALAFRDPAERGHFLGDVPAFLIIFIVLFLLMPREEEVRSKRRF